MGCYSGRLRRSKVALPVADQKASIDIHCVPLKQSSNQPRLRLTATAENTVTLNQAIGVVRAKFECIDMRANYRKLMRHPVVQIVNMQLLVKSPRNS